MKKSFTLVEILIVVTILGILAAVIMPSIKDYVQQAKESAAKDNLRILRNAIGLYAAQHGGIAPGYPDNDPSKNPSRSYLVIHLIGGKYLNQIPENPFNGFEISHLKIIGNNDPFPDTPTGTASWVYKPATKEIRLDWTGTDSAGVSYYDY
ncbi:MAG: prepilin-type N-terminal cleavage/methylation domain-containing protein [Sedimentisphaerales bacterium]|nr:prepilin-type N-terminal cleavage/methylation domain-containing protein [Sedimentisphaerales bacterium]